MKIDITGGSYDHKYLDLNAQRSINWYPVATTQSEKDTVPISLFPTPGLSAFITLPGRYHRAFKVIRGKITKRCLALVDNILYEVFSNGSYSTLGTLSNLSVGSSRVYMLANGNGQVFLGHPECGYVYDLTANTLVQITDPFYPGCEYASYMDGYLFVIVQGFAYYSNLEDFITWPSTGGNSIALTFRTAGVKAVSTFRDDVYFFSNETMEPYINDNVTPFQRMPKSSQLIGILAPDTLVTFNDGQFFLGSSDEGQVGFYFVDGNYTITQISEFSTSWKLNQGIELNKSQSFIQRTKDGHIWIYLTIPGLNTTLVYDWTTKMWHERQSIKPFQDIDGEQKFSSFRGKSCVNFEGLNLFADRYSGKIFKEDFTINTEDSNMIRRLRRSIKFEAERTPIEASDLEIIADCGKAATIDGQGSNPIMMLRTSKDGGLTYSEPRNILLGALGNYSYRARINKLGTSRIGWVLELSTTDPIDITIQSAIAHGVTGSGE
jgi:hypothetical protein